MTPLQEEAPMTRFFALTVAAALTAGGVGFLIRPAVAAQDDAAAARQAGDQAAKRAADLPKASFPPGVQTKEVQNADGIRAPLAEASEAALTKGGFDDLVERLVDQDRNRIGDYADQEFTELDGIIDAVRKQWKDKYNDDFDVDDKKAFTKVVLMQGEIQDPNLVATHWPVPPVQAGAGEAVAAAERKPPPTDANNPDSNIEKGRDVALAVFPASHGLPQINVSLVREATGWRIDVPNNVTGPQLNAALSKHLTHIKDNAAQWPADVNEATTMVAHHVMMALYNLDMPGAQRQQ
jgi:hypothetical protein